MQPKNMVIGRSWDGHGNEWAKENEAILLHHRRFFLMFVGFRWFAGAPGAPSSHTEACSRFWQNTMRSSNVAERLLLCGFLGFEDPRCPCSSHRGSCFACNMPIRKDKGKIGEDLFSDKIRGPEKVMQ